MRFDSSSLALLSLLASTLLLRPARSQEPMPPGPVTLLAARPSAAEDEPPMSIFNDQMRRFKFLLEHDVATVATAEEFVVRYRRPNNPRIVGAYPDAQTNALVVIGPPESEQAIRASLAEWVVESGGTGRGQPLAMQLRILQHERRGCLEIMAGIEVQQVKAAATTTEKAKEPQLAAKLQVFEGELAIVEQQIQVVRKYMDRLAQDDPAPAAPAGQQ